MTNFFFISTYDNISGKLLSSIINKHPDIECNAHFTDAFLPAFLHYGQDSFALTPDKEFSSFEAQMNLTLDKFMVFNTHLGKKYSGDVQTYGALQLQHKTLIEKTAQPYCKVNLQVSPMLRVNFILQSWKQLNFSPDKLLSILQNQLTSLKNNSENVYGLYNFNYFYNEIYAFLNKHNPEVLSSTQSMLFIIALSKVIAYDSADMPIAGKSFNFEKIINDEKVFVEFFHHITRNELTLSPEFSSEIAASLEQTIQTISDMGFQEWEPWQTNLLDTFINKRLYTIYYPHIDKPLIDFYRAAGYASTKAQTKAPRYSKLISLQLNSNRPAQLAAYFDNIEETAHNPKDIEVLVNIDIGSAAMKTMLDNEIPKRKFTLKYIETPRPASFCDLWQPINKLLDITDPNCYFLLNISDEMLFVTQGWDTILKKYVGYFPDHLFRLRASRNKFRNYFDRWECSFAQDSIPITTKKWIDIGGDWNPCFGPDSFQQLISFYLSKEGMFSNEHYLRDVPLIDIKFAGDVPALGISDEKRWKHIKDHIKAMEICQSYRMQLEARRRAILIKANIYVHKEQLVNFSIHDKKRRKSIWVLDKNSDAVVAKFDYSVSRIKIMITNFWRHFFFFNYFGDGIQNRRKKILRKYLHYVSAKYAWLNYIKKKIQRYRVRSHTAFQLLEENKVIKELLHILSFENKKLKSGEHVKAKFSQQGNQETNALKNKTTSV